MESIFSAHARANVMRLQQMIHNIEEYEKGQREAGKNPTLKGYKRELQQLLDEHKDKHGLPE